MKDLLPRSGVGVLPPWLVIAPAGNPPIRLDLRFLDTIERAGEHDERLELEEEEAKALPEEAAARRRSTVILVRGELEVTLYIADGEEAAARIVSEAAPFTREHAGGTPPAEPGEAPLRVGEDAVTRIGDLVQVGKRAFRIDEVREYALIGANLPLSGGHLLQAAMALFVVEEETRDVLPAWGITIERRRPRIRQVSPGSAADAAGLRVGDELVSLSITSEVVMRFRRGDERIVFPIPPDEPGETSELSPLIGRPAASFTASTMDGAILSLRDLVGHVVFLDFWGTACEAEERVRRLSAIQDKHSQLRVVGVSTEPRRRVRRFLESNPVTYSLVDDEDRSIATSYHAEPPMLVVIDEQGVIRRIELGTGDFDTLLP